MTPVFTVSIRIEGDRLYVLPPGHGDREVPTPQALSRIAKRGSYTVVRPDGSTREGSKYDIRYAGRDFRFANQR